MKQLSLKLHHFRRIAILFLLLVALQAFTTCGGNKKDKKSPQEEWYSKVNIPTSKHFHQVVANKKLDEVKQIFILLDASPFKEKDEKELLDSVVGGTTALGKAIEGGDEQMVQLLIQQPQIDINKTGRIDDTAKPIPSLFLALKLTKPRIAEILLTNDTNEKLDVAYKDPASGNTSLHLAAREGYLNVVEELLKCPKIDVTLTDSMGNTPFDLAEKNKHHDCANALFPIKDPMVLDSWVFNDLKANNFSEKRIDYWLAKGLNINARINASIDSSMPTLLMFAVSKIKLKPLVELLISKQASVNQKDDSGLTPLHFAAYLNLSGIAKCLIANGASVNAKDDFGLTPFSVAVSTGSVDVAEVLLKEKKFNYESSTINGKTALDLAKETGHDDCLKLIEKFLNSQKSK